MRENVFSVFRVKIRALESEIRKLREIVNKQVFRIASISSDYKEVEITCEDRVKELSKELQQKEDECRLLKYEVDREKQAHEPLSKHRKLIECSRAEEAAVLKEKLRSAGVQIFELECKVDECMRVNDQQKLEISRLKEERQQYQANYAKLVKEIEACSSESSRLEASVETVIKINKSLEDSLYQKRCEHEDLKKDFILLGEKFRDSEKALMFKSEEAEMTRSDSIHKHHFLLKKCYMLEAELMREETKSQTLSSKMNALEQQISQSLEMSEIISAFSLQKNEKSSEAALSNNQDASTITVDPSTADQACQTEESAESHEVGVLSQDIFVGCDVYDQNGGNGNAYHVNSSAITIEAPMDIDNLPDGIMDVDQCPVESRQDQHSSSNEPVAEIRDFLNQDLQNQDTVNCRESSPRYSALI